MNGQSAVKRVKVPKLGGMNFDAPKNNKVMITKEAASLSNRGKSKKKSRRHSYFQGNP